MRSVLFIVFLALVFILPVLILVLYSVSGVWQYPDIFPGTFSFHSIKYLVRNIIPIAISMGSSLLYSLAAVLLSFLITVFPAHAFARTSFRFKLVLEALLLSPALVPSITFSMGIHIFFLFIGISDTFPGVVIVLTFYSYPYMLRALITGFKSYSCDYDKCAENLGTGLWARMIKIDIPLLLPSFFAGGAVVFLVAFSEYFLVFLIGGGLVPSYTGYLFPYLNSADRPVASLFTLIFFIIPVILFVIMESTINRIYKKQGLMK